MSMQSHRAEAQTADASSYEDQQHERWQIEADDPADTWLNYDAADGAGSAQEQRAEIEHMSVWQSGSTTKDTVKGTTTRLRVCSRYISGRYGQLSCGRGC